MTHKLKIEPNYLENLLLGNKKAEVRFNDRDYQCGDVLEFYNYERGVIHFQITHIHSGLGLKEGFVVLSLRSLEEKP